jgi:hypothetical protein
MEKGGQQKNAEKTTTGRSKQPVFFCETPTYLPIVLHHDANPHVTNVVVIHQRQHNDVLKQLGFVILYDQFLDDCILASMSRLGPRNVRMDK